jgi:hypothetical protein
VIEIKFFEHLHWGRTKGGGKRRTKEGRKDEGRKDKGGQEKNGAGGEERSEARNE